MTDFRVGEPVRVAGNQVPVMRIVGRNAGPMTGAGTNTYLVGSKQLALIDPGPSDDVAMDSIVAAIGKRKLKRVLVTHTHGDHSPAATPIARKFSAELIGLPPPESGNHDRSFSPDRDYKAGEILDCGEFTIELIHTPGHVSNHFCYLLQEEKLLFTGDHILQGTTSVILPPDGNMSDYMASLDELLKMDLNFLAPGHGHIMNAPAKAIEALIAHRMAREKKIVSALKELGSSTLDKLTLKVYDDVAPHLIPWAKLTLEAHLIKLRKDSKVEELNQRWKLL